MKARIFGAGSIGNHLSNALRKLNYEIELVDIDKSALDRTKNEIYPSRYGKWDKSIKLLTLPSEDFVDLEIIGTPPDTHANILLERLKQNKSRYWLVEKPFTIPSQTHIEELERKIGKFKDSIFVGYNHSVSPAFKSLIEDINKCNNPTKISCTWEEHWGGIFNAHPWLDGPKDSYLGFKNRGGGALMEHSHGIHLLTILFDIFNFKINELKASVILDKEQNYDEKTYVAFNFKNSDALSFYSTDVITKNVKKSLEIEADNQLFSLTFGSDNGTNDTYIKKTKSNQIIKKFSKTRADDFIYEMKLLDELIKDKKRDAFLKNISCEKALKVALICANIFDNS
tara:strand:+ start:1 stop:1023 length:1023 start_codon:yes stop_codon:yes gene_type:complete